ncbi:MAG: hypothetical protein KAG98_03760, partial [Lentisphaeria bacterium]|nr:hypothetical protein [Lentisphaeria bacterium]
RSHIVINSKKGKLDQGWRIGQNYQLFRYMLGCNAYGKYPTKFNGSLFTFDGHFTVGNSTPDFRLWGGGSFTAQNQRLVYWPMLKSGDFDMMHSQFNFYLRMLKNAELRTKTYWNHNGACFVEQIENFGLPIASTYYHVPRNLKFTPRTDKQSTRTLKNSKGKVVEVIDQGYLTNPWTGDEYETILEFCLMILDVEQFSGEDISRYMPLIESSLLFFDEHYRYWGNKLNGSPLDKDGHLVLYPSTACETYKMATNPTPLIAGLKTVLLRMLELPEKYISKDQHKKWKSMLGTIPPIALRKTGGHTVIAPAKKWERISNIEFPQMYAVYPYSFYGIGKPDLNIAIDTWNHGFDNNNQRQSHCWFQSGIFCARIGLTKDAVHFLKAKMLHTSRRFPAFWDCKGFDQCPDFDHGGAGMVQLQEMLLQTTNGKDIRILPTWPKEWTVDFKLHAPYKTVIEAKAKNGKTFDVKVSPKSRTKHIVKVLSK